jgi:hypothetical protein
MAARPLVALALLALLAGAACAPSAPPANQQAVGGQARPPADGTRGQSVQAVANAPDASQQAQGLPAIDRMIVRTITLTLSVANVQDAYHQVQQIATEQGGLVANAQIRQDGERSSATVTLRVPTDPATYQATLERLRALAQRVVEEQDKAQDVTEEYVDLDSRLRSLRASETSLLGLYQKAERLEDVFAVQRELTTVRGQIEQIEGRRQVLARQAAVDVQ